MFPCGGPARGAPWPGVGRPGMDCCEAAILGEAQEWVWVNVEVVVDVSCS